MDETIRIADEKCVYRRGNSGEWDLVCTCEQDEDARWIAHLLVAKDPERIRYAYTDKNGYMLEAF